VQLQQIIHVHYVRFMPYLGATALLSSVFWLIVVRSQWRTAEFWLVAVSACSILVLTAATWTISAPLNKELMTWSVATPPATLRDIWAPWDRVNTLRTVLATAALLLETTALSLKR
jgi:thiol:disulfide interchange protein